MRLAAVRDRADDRWRHQSWERPFSERNALRGRFFASAAGLPQ
jgi:hypothetical protein